MTNILHTARRMEEVGGRWKGGGGINNILHTARRMEEVGGRWKGGGGGMTNILHTARRRGRGEEKLDT